MFELELQDGDNSGRLRIYRLPPSAHARLLVRIDPSSSSEDPVLTPRQLEVLSHVQAGLEPRAISAKLGLALATTRRHLADVSRKLGAARRTGRLMQRSRELDELGCAAGLTERQTEVARQVCLGKDNAAIGLALGIAPATVGSLLTKVYRKLEVRGRHALAAKLSGWLRGG
jgi:DNA-binding NarL/FixJ family response regulator